MVLRDVDWVSGGATIIKRKYCQTYSIVRLPNAFEDQDYAFRLREAGFRLVNCPDVSLFIHHISSKGSEEVRRENDYVQAR